MMKVTPRLLVTVVLLWAVTVAVQSRPATDSGESEIEVSAELSPSVLMVPIQQLTDPNSAFGRMLKNQLLKMSEPELQAIETRQTEIKTETGSLDAGDMMMGDMPSADDSQDSSSPATTFKRATAMPDNYRDEMSHGESPESADPEIREKKNRLQAIRDQMLYPSDTFTEKTQSFYPTCDLPKHTNEDVWNSRDTMNLMFNISLPKSSKGITVNVNTARLRLYKQFVSCYSQSSNEFDDPQTNESTLFAESTNKSKTNLSTASAVPIIMYKRQIRVSIYLYTRSLKRKRVKRRLLDSRMVPYYSEEWTEWNIHNAIQFWHRNPVRNYGINVEVEDVDGNLLPVGQFFKTMNCSGDAQMITSKPAQGFLMDAVENGYGNPAPTTKNSNTNTGDALALNFNMHMYPIMDVTTIEVPKPEENAMLYQYAKNTIEQVGGRGAGSLSNLSPGQEDQLAESQHQIRHGSYQHRANGTVPGNLSTDTSTSRV